MERIAQRPKESFKNAIDYLREMSTTREFLEERSKESDIGKIIGTVAARLTEDVRQEHSGYIDIDTSAKNIIGKITSFVEAQTRLDNDRKRNIKLNVKDKKTVISYNHALRECVDNYPSLKVADIMNLVGQAGNILLGDRVFDKAVLASGTRQIIRCMQNEIFVESALWRLKGVDNVRSATAEEELKGIDIVATLQSGEEITLDAKSSLTGENKALEEWQPGEAIPFWSGINSRDLGDSMRPSETQIQLICDRFRSQTNQLSAIA